MPKLNKTVLVPYSDSQMFDLVDRVEDYPQFLPWCPSTHVQRDAEGMLATVGIHFKGIRQSFTTRNRSARPESITMDFVDGPFRRLHGHWHFRALSEDACKVEFELDYEIAGGLLGKVLAPVFGQITASFVDAFVRRAEAVYR